MRLIYSDAVQIDWKEVKTAWDKEFFFFQMEFRHNGHWIQLHSELSVEKRYRLMLYIDGFWEGIWGSTDVEHEYRKYHHKKLIRRSKNMKALDVLNKRLAKLNKRKYVEPEPMYYYTPIFDNIAQVKVMVKNLEVK